MDEPTPKLLPAFKPTPQMQALMKKVEDAKEAIQIAEAAEPVVVHDENGKEVHSLKVRLTAQETRRVMSLPLEQRSAMATRILQERRLAANARKALAKAEQTYTRERKAERRRKKKNKRRGR